MSPSEPSPCWAGSSTDSARFNITISGTDITITNPAEPLEDMTGTIDAQCHANVAHAVPPYPYRALDGSVNAAAMTMVGTYTSERWSDGCRGFYDLTMSLMPGHV